MAADSSVVFKAMNERRKQGEWCDFEIKVQEKKFPVHRLVLDTCSKYFHTMLAGGTQESNDGCCELEDVDPEAVETCIEFMYTGEMNITATDAINVLKVAHIWQLEKAMIICEKKLDGNLSKNCCFSYWKLAKMYSLETLLSHCNSFIFSQTHLITESNEIANLSSSELHAIMREKKKNVCNPIDLWSLCTKWSCYDGFRHFCDIVKEFPFEEFQISDFINVVMETMHMKECEKCRKIACVKFLSSIDPSAVTVENCLVLKSLANYYGCESQKITLRNFIIKNYKTVFLRSEFQILATEEDITDYVSYLTSENCKCTASEFSAIVSWLKYDHNREGAFPRLFSSINHSEETINFFSSLLFLDNVLFIKKLAHKYSCPAINDASDRCIIECFPSIIQLPESLELQAEHLVLYLQNPASYGTEPTEIWQFIINWINFNYAERKMKFPLLFQSLRLKIFPTDFIKKTICRCHFVKECNECLALMIGHVFHEMEIRELEYANMSNEIKQIRLKLDKAIEKWTQKEHWLKLK